MPLHALEWFIARVPMNDPEKRLRSRLLVQVLSSGVVASASLGVMFSLWSAWPTALVCLGTFAVLAALLAMLRRTGRTTAITHLGIAVTFVLFLVPTAEEHLDGAALAWLAMVPYVAVLLLELRWAVMWFVMVVVSVATVSWLRNAGLMPLLPSVEPAVPLVRVIGLTGIIFYFGHRFSTERKSALRELERVNRAKSAFLANISHEIRTPMNGVLGLTDLLLEAPLEAGQREHIALIQRSGQAMVALINDLLDMSKIEAGKLTIEHSDFSLTELLDDLRSLGEPLAQHHGLVFEVKHAGTLPAYLRGDPLRLRQVLSNLINNAIKFTPKGAVTLDIGTSSSDRLTITFSVRDTGIGIAPEVLPRLFTPFQQADDSTTRRFGGTGLGLALSKELVQRMGGELKVHSVLGQGSTFTFTLTFVEGVGALAAAAVPPMPHKGSSQHEVLIVDDNPINLKVAVGLVERAGYRAATATNGAEAVRLVQERAFLAVLMDCHMPVMDGFEATETIRKLDTEACLVPIIALTASAMPDELERCRHAGMNDCLVKPVSLRTLSHTLGQFETLDELARSA